MTDILRTTIIDNKVLLTMSINSEFSLDWSVQCYHCRILLVQVPSWDCTQFPYLHLAFIVASVYGVFYGTLVWEIVRTNEP